MPRESLLARTFVELADTLVDEFDVVELLTLLTDRSVEVIGASAAGIMLAGINGELSVAASSSEAMRVLELFELQCQEGPCLDCFGSGEPIVNQDIAASSGRWPHFSPACLSAGFTSVHAVPMRLRGTTIGALNLFSVERGSLSGDDVIAAQAFADVATIAILQHRSAAAAQVVIEELHHALNSRVLIEQAKGFLAQRENIDVENAFGLMRRHARNNNLLLIDVAQGVIDGTVDTNALTDAAKSRRPKA
jgi:GAF domain-containing protein